jgi:hypothetical protein
VPHRSIGTKLTSNGYKPDFGGGLANEAAQQLFRVAKPRRATLDVIKRAFETAGVEFIEENGGGPGVRLRKPTKQKR